MNSDPTVYIHTNPNSAQPSALSYACRMYTTRTLHVLSHALGALSHALGALSLALGVLSLALGALSLALGALSLALRTLSCALSRDIAQPTQPCRDTRDLCHNPTEQAPAAIEKALLRHTSIPHSSPHYRDTKVMSQHGIDPACSPPCRDTGPLHLADNPVTIENLLSRQRILETRSR